MGGGDPGQVNLVIASYVFPSFEHIGKQTNKTTQSEGSGVGRGNIHS